MGWFDRFRKREEPVATTSGDWTDGKITALPNGDLITLDEKEYYSDYSYCY